MKKLQILLFVTFLFSCGGNGDIPEIYLDNTDVDRILIVRHKDGANAQALFYIRTGDEWKLYVDCPALIGKNGIGKTREGDNKTPKGDFAVTGAFGIRPNPGTELPYTDITPGIFACDEDCQYYNMIIDTALVHHRCKGEDMHSIDPQYRYGMTIDFNSERIYPAGSAIFIHCKGEKPYTAGCVAVAESDLVKILKESHPGMRVIIR